MLIENNVRFNENIKLNEDSKFNALATLYANKIRSIDEPLYVIIFDVQVRLSPCWANFVLRVSAVKKAIKVSPYIINIKYTEAVVFMKPGLSKFLFSYIQILNKFGIHFSV